MGTSRVTIQVSLGWRTTLKEDLAERMTYTGIPANISLGEERWEQKEEENSREPDTCWWFCKFRADHERLIPLAPTWQAQPSCLPWMQQMAPPCVRPHQGPLQSVEIQLSGPFWKWWHTMCKKKRGEHLTEASIYFPASCLDGVRTTAVGKIGHHSGCRQVLL